MKYPFLITIVFAASAFFFACSSGNESPGAQQNDPPKTVQIAQNTQSTQTVQPAEADFSWYTDWDKGLEAAKKEQKPVIVDFYADWCVYCKKMEKETFTAPEIKKRLAEGWIAIKVDLGIRDKQGTFDGKTMTYPQLASYFGVNGLPTYLFIDKEGKPVYPYPGYVPKEQFGPMLDYFKEELYTKKIKLSDYVESKS
jgi:thioredoxin-related protein